MGEPEFEGGNPFPAEYENLGNIKAKMKLVWHCDMDEYKPEVLDKADVVILGKTESEGQNSGKTVMAHAIVKCDRVKDPYIKRQIKRLRETNQQAAAGIRVTIPWTKMYCSKSGCGGPVCLHSLEVYTTDPAYKIIGLY